MVVLRILLMSLVSLILLFFLTKWMGSKQMSQLSLFDYIIGISIGSIAAEMATETSPDFWQPLVSMIVYGALATGISLINNHSRKLRRWISGSPLVLMDKGELYRANMKKAKMDLEEFLIQCREQGYFDLSQIETAILESNGKLSILPRSAYRPVTPSDLALPIRPEYPPRIVLMDGQVLEDNLKAAGYDQNWLSKQLSEADVSDPTGAFLAAVDSQGTLQLYKKHEKPYITHQYS